MLLVLDGVFTLNPSPHSLRNVLILAFCARPVEVLSVRSLLYPIERACAERKIKTVAAANAATDSNGNSGPSTSSITQMKISTNQTIAAQRSYHGGGTDQSWERAYDIYSRS